MVYFPKFSEIINVCRSVGTYLISDDFFYDKFKNSDLFLVLFSKKQILILRLVLFLSVLITKLGL